MPDCIKSGSTELTEETVLGGVQQVRGHYYNAQALCRPNENGERR